MSRKSRERRMPDTIVGPAVFPWVEFGWWAGLAWMAFVALSYVHRSAPVNLLPVLNEFWPPGFPTLAALGRHLRGLAVGAGLLAGSLALGAWILGERFNRSALGRLVIANALGLGVVAYAVYLLGALGLYRTWILALLWAGLAGLFFWRLKPQLGALIENALGELLVSLKASSLLLVLPLLIMVAVAFLLAFVPEIFYDSHVYHLGVPRWYLLMGGIKEYPNLHANYPLTMSMLYLVGLALSGDTAAKLVHWSCGVLIMLGLIAWSNEERRPRAGPWAALIFLSMPMVMWNWWSTGTDVGVSLFALAGAWCWFRFIDSPEESADRSLLALAGIFGGLCFGSKLTAGLVMALLPVFHLAWGIVARRAIRGVIRECFFMGVVSFAMALPWLIRAYIFTGNPVFPFGGSFFASIDPARMAHVYAENRGMTPDSFWQWCRLPWRLAFEGGSSLSFPGPFVLAVFPVAAWGLFARKDVSTPMKMIFLLGLCGCLGVAAINRLTRYWLPYLAILVMPVGLICEEGAATPFRRWAFHSLATP
ncbi:MAG: hypothetical protein AAB091_02800, partial [Elusimicrobiota bacterium]